MGITSAVLGSIALVSAAVSYKQNKDAAEDAEKAAAEQQQAAAYAAVSNSAEDTDTVLKESEEINEANAETKRRRMFKLSDTVKSSMSSLGSNSKLGG